MLVFLEKIFDNYITGAQNVYTEDGYADLLGSVDSPFVMAVVTAVTGTSPTITLQVEGSPNGSRWMPQVLGPPQIVNQGIIAGSNIAFRSDSISSATICAMPGLCRLRIQLGGTNPAANLIIFASGRDT